MHNPLPTNVKWASQIGDGRVFFSKTYDLLDYVDTILKDTRWDHEMTLASINLLTRYVLVLTQDCHDFIEGVSAS